MVSASVSRVASRVTRVAVVVCVLAGAWFAATPEALAQPASQQPPSTLAATTPDEPEGIPILYRGREIFRVRRALGPITAAQRAETIQALLDANVRADTSPDDFTVVEFPAYTEIRIRDVVLGVVTEQDAEAVGLPRQLVATRVLTQLKLVVIQARAEFTPRAITFGIGLIIVSTIVLALLLRGVSRVYRRVMGTIDEWRERKLLGVRIQRVQLITPERQAATLSTLSRWGYVALVVIAVTVWLEIALAALPWTRPYSRLVVAYLVAPLSFAWGAFLDYLPSLAFLIVITAITYGMLRVVHFLFREVERGTIKLPNFQAEWAEPTYKIVRVLLIALAFVAAFPYIPGSGSPAFQGISLFLGLLVSLASSSAISNVIAGTILTYTGAFRMGDRVQVAETMGDVVHKSLLVTQVRTIKNVLISIPNSLVLGAQIRNFSALSRDAGLILHTTVTIGYDAPWRTVHELLISAALATDGIVAEPAPFVLQTALDDFYVSYEINAYTRQANRMIEIYSTLHANIQDAFNKGGVEIMSPHYSSLRDGNTTTIPADHLPADYRAPAFRVDGPGTRSRQDE